MLYDPKRSLSYVCKHYAKLKQMRGGRTYFYLSQTKKNHVANVLAIDNLFGSEFGSFSSFTDLYYIVSKPILKGSRTIKKSP